MVKRHIKNLILYKLVGAVPAESVPGLETNFVYAKNHHFPRGEK